tara:strand:- start:53 stop:499 length:447 start_codon:yes stop_codon:yes gene_type:complete
VTTSLTIKIQEDLKAAMKRGDRATVSALRLIIAAIKQREIDTRKALTDSEAVVILNRLSKQRKDSISQYLAASRNDLASVEENELKIIEDYLPEQLSSEEIESKVLSAIESIGAKSLKDMGKVMAKLKAELQGNADMSVVSEITKKNL